MMSSGMEVQRTTVTTIHLTATLSVANSSIPFMPQIKLSPCMITVQIEVPEEVGHALKMCENCAQTNSGMLIIHIFVNFCST